MKRLLIIYLLYSTFIIPTFAWNSDPHLVQLIKCINDSDFVCAADELTKVENWSPAETWLITFHALTFLKQEYVLNYPPQYIDSFRLYVAEEADSYRVKYTKRGEYSKALLYAKLAAKFRAVVLGTKHPDYAISLSKLGGAFCDVGDYNSAQENYLRSIEIAQYFTRDNVCDYEILLNNIGTFYFIIGDYIKAEEYYVKDLMSIKDRQGNLLNETVLLSNLGVLYSSIGDYNMAEEYYLLALKSDSIYKGTNSPIYANDIELMGALYSEKGEYQKAELCYKHALEIRRGLGMGTYPIYALNLDKLGILYVKTGKFEEAETHFMQALQILEKVVGKEDQQYADQLLSIGFYYYKIKEFTTAERYYSEALKIVEKHIGEKFRNYSNYLILLNNLSVLYYDMYEYTKADYYLKMCTYYSKERFLNSLTFFSEKQRTHFWTTIKDYFEIKTQRLTYRYYSQEPHSAFFAYDNELFRKGVLLQSTNIIQQSIIESSDTTLTHIWKEFINLKLVIDYLQQREPDSKFLSEYEELAEQVEKAIIKSSAAYRENQAMWQITWDSVRNHLSSNQIAIEYMVAPLNGDSTMYCALLLRDTCSYPVMIPLFNESEVTPLVNTSTENQTSFTYSYDGNGKQLSQLVWSKILPYIKKGETIYFAPSGLLHQLAIESLPYDENHTMADIFNLVRLSSTREIVSRKSDTQHSSAALYGGIQYDVNTDELLAESEKYSTNDLLASRGIESDTIDRGSIKYLKGTKAEVESINSMLKQNNLQVQLFTSTNANEESFKALSGKHQNILHIATHGFFWTDSTAQKKEYFSQRMFTVGQNMPSPPSIDPLNRCGLLFAGAQTAWSGHSAELPEGVQDGILTAKEISLLDLRDADLVVLSACETGKGEITGDGVFGLQRAFKQAGAQTIIMSLWPVNDAATQLLMTEFYRNWITNHQSKCEAFKNAQNTVRSKYEEPIYWAGFIMLD